jgi:hypothetical protein
VADRATPNVVENLMEPSVILSQQGLPEMERVLFEQSNPLYRQSSDPSAPAFNLYRDAPPLAGDHPLLVVNTTYPPGVTGTTYDQYEIYCRGGYLYVGESGATGPFVSSDRVRAGPSLAVILTVDDGPHSSALISDPLAGDVGRNNRTERWLDFMKVRTHNGEEDGLVGAWFVQTHAPARGQTPEGKILLRRMKNERQIIGVHTGSNVDHTSHTIRVALPAMDYDGNGIPEGSNALESDLIRARTFLSGEDVGYRPVKYVRAPGFTLGKTGTSLHTAVCSSYSAVGLKHIGAQVYLDSKGYISGVDPSAPEDALGVISHSYSRGIYKNSDKFVVFLLHCTPKNWHTLASIGVFT